MRIPSLFGPLALLTALLVTLLPVSAGTLDLAVVQLTGLVAEEDVNQALEGQNLREAAFGDRFEIRDQSFRGSPVLFSQTLGVRLGDRFLSSMRVGGQRAEVEGQISANQLKAQVVISEGVQKPLRRFSQMAYRGQGRLVTGPARVLSLRQVDVRQPSVVRGQARVASEQFTIALLYQYRP